MGAAHRWLASQLLHLLAAAVAAAAVAADAGDAPPTSAPLWGGTSDAAPPLPAMSPPLANGCQPEEFRCKSLAKCISMDAVCDGKINCPDGSDEPPSCVSK